MDEGFAFGAPLRSIEQRRGSRTLAIALSHIEIELLPTLYDVLAKIGPVPRLDILFYCRGGATSAARRMMQLLRSFAGHLTFIVPDRCESSGTMALLAADEIIAGPVAVFSPCDPHLQTDGSESDRPLSISSEEVRLHSEMAQNWFGVPATEARAQAFAALSAAIFPTALTAFFRSDRESAAICEEMLAPRTADQDARQAIIDALLHGSYCHSFALSRDDLARIGLPVARDSETEADAWSTMRVLRDHIGGGARDSEADSWLDCIVATRDGAMVRERRPAMPRPVWRELGVT